MADWISTAELIVEELEKAKGFWDEQGLDMHLAVLQDPTDERVTLAVSTKHWASVHYVHTEETRPDVVWNVLRSVCQEAGRMAVRSVQGPYVYIPKLNAAQTQTMLDKVVDTMRAQHITNYIARKWQISWNIRNAVTPPINAEESEK